MKLEMLFYGVTIRELKAIAIDFIKIIDIVVIKIS